MNGTQTKGDQLETLTVSEYNPQPAAYFKPNVFTNLYVKNFPKDDFDDASLIVLTY